MSESTNIKTVENSKVVMTELVLPNHTNQLGNLLGGQLMHWIDICAAISAAKHAGSVCVTASVDKIDFHQPIKLGNVVTLTAKVNRVFSSSMEVGVEVFAECFTDGTKIHSNSAFLTFVNVDKNGKPVKTEKIIPETGEEKKLYEDADTRRKQRLNNRSAI